MFLRIEEFSGFAAMSERIQGSSRHSFAFGRFAGEYVSIFEMRPLASFEMFLQSGSSKANLPVLTDFIISTSVGPLKGGYPQRRM